MSSSYINQIDAAIGAVQPIAGQNITVTPSPTGGLVIALPSSIAVPGTVTSSQLAVVTTGTTGLTFANPVVATPGNPVVNPPKVTFGGSLWYGLGLTANPSTWSITPNSGTLNFTFSSATPLGGNAVVNISDRLQAGSIIAGSSQFNFQTGSAGSVFPASSVANSVGNLATYQVTIAPGGQVTLGQNVTITGFTNAANNGTFVVNGSSTSTLIVYNSAAVAETHAATVTTQGTFFSQAGYDVVFSPTDTMPILGTSHSIIAGFEGLPSQVNLALNSKGNSVDSGYMRLVNDGVTGNHGMEIGGISDGTGAKPVILDMGHFNGASSAYFTNVVPATSLLSQSNAPILGVSGQYWTGSASAADTWGFVHTLSSTPVSTLTLNHVGAPGVFNITNANQFNVLTGQVTFGALNVNGQFVEGTAFGNGPSWSFASVTAGVGTATYFFVSPITVNAFPGSYVTVAGFTNLGNNGRFIIQSLSTTQVVVYNASAVTETSAATGAVDNSYGNTSFSLTAPGDNNFPLLGTTYTPQEIIQSPASVPIIALASNGNATDAAYFRIINDGVSGDHGLEIGAIVDGTGAAPVIFQLGDFGDPAPSANLLNTAASTGVTLGAPAPRLQFTGSVWNGTASIGDTWAIEHIPSWNISQGATSELLFKHLTPGAVTSINLDGSVQSFFGQSTSWAIGPTSVTSLITPTGLIGFVVSTVSAASAAVGGLTTYTWSISPSTATNITAGMYFTIAGFTNAGNNGRFLVQSTPTATSLVVFNSGGVAETHAATATIDNPYSSGGVWLLEGDIGIGHYPIGAASPGVNQNIIAAPNVVSLALTAVGDNKDSAYLRIVNNATSGIHGLEVGSIFDGTATNPIVLQMASGAPVLGGPIASLLLPGSVPVTGNSTGVYALSNHTAPVSGYTSLASLQAQADTGTFAGSISVAGISGATGSATLTVSTSGTTLTQAGNGGITITDSGGNAIAIHGDQSISIVNNNPGVGGGITIQDMTATGLVNIAGAANIQINATGTLFLSNVGTAPVSVGRHLNAASTDFAGLATVSSSTSVTVNFASNYTGTSAPLVVLTPTTDPTTAGTYWVVVNGSTGAWTGFTINIHNSTTISFNYVVIGNVS